MQFRYAGFVITGFCRIGGYELRFEMLTEQPPTSSQGLECPPLDTAVTIPHPVHRTLLPRTVRYVFA